MKPRKYVLGASLLAVAAATALSVSSAASAAGDPAEAAAPLSLSAPVQAKSLGVGVKLLRSTNFAAASGLKGLARAPGVGVQVNRAIPSKSGAAGAAAGQAVAGPNIPIKFPTVPSLPISAAPASVFAQTGQTLYDQQTYGGYNLEPPDVDIAAGNGTLVQTANNIITVYDQTGHAITAPISMEAFFGDFNSFLSDPKVYWDQDTKHYFVTELAYDFFAGAYSGVYIAVSQTGNPAGGWNIYFLDTTDPFGNSGCFFDIGFACLPDQPLLGADKWTLQISTNEFQIFDGFNGAQMFYIDKTALATGNLFPSAVAEDYNDDFGTPASGCFFPLWYSVQPAESPNAAYDLHFNGTSYALSSLDFCNLNDNRTSIWVSVNTKSISSVFPSIGIIRGTISNTALPYGPPPEATQPNGSIPLGEFLGEFTSPQITANDDRMNEVEYNNATHMLMGGLNTGAFVQPGATHFHVAALAFTNKLFWSGSTLFVTKGGSYIANLNADVLFPASASNPHGNGVWGYSIMGGDPLDPSTGVSSFSATTKPNKILISNPGAGPADGFTGYAAFGVGPPERWGDYSGAVADGNKVFWSAEYIAQTCSFGEWLFDDTCGGTRTFFGNWAESLAGTTLP